MHSLTRQITTKAWVRPLVYSIVVATIGATAYGYHALTTHAESTEAHLQATLLTLSNQQEAQSSYQEIVTLRAAIAIAGGETAEIDAQLTQLALLIRSGTFADAIALAETTEASAKKLLEVATANLEAAEIEALKSGVLTISATNGAAAEVVVIQGETTVLTGTTDDNGILTATLPVGSYTVAVSKYGFSSITTESVVITGKQVTPLTLVMSAAPTPTPSASSTPKATATPTAKATSTPSSSTAHSSYRRTTVVSSRGSFTTDIMEFQLGAGKVKVVADTAADYDCTADCPTLAVKSYVQRHAGAIAGINGTYFCAADYSSCTAEKGYFFWKIYNTRLSRMMNAGTGLGEADPFLIFDSVGNPTFLSYWNQHPGKSFVAGINHKPAVVRNGAYSVDEGALDDKQRTAKVSRGAIGVTGNTLYVVVVQSATVMDLGAVMVAIGADNALNIDGGGSSAMYYNGEYKRGPGRGVPNALVFVEQ